MEFNDLVEMMQSSDYRMRFKAEYIQLKIRYENLQRMIDKYDAGTLDFEPDCPLELLKEQAHHLGVYLSVLEKRAEIENI